MLFSCCVTLWHCLLNTSEVNKKDKRRETVSYYSIQSLTRSDLKKSSQQKSLILHCAVFFCTGLAFASSTSHWHTYAVAGAVSCRNERYVPATGTPRKKIQLIQWNGNIESFQLNQLNIHLREWKYLFESSDTLYWTAMRKFYPVKIKIYWIDIFNDGILAADSCRWRVSHAQLKIAWNPAMEV